MRGTRRLTRRVMRDGRNSVKRYLASFLIRLSRPPSVPIMVRHFFPAKLE